MNEKTRTLSHQISDVITSATTSHMQEVHRLDRRVAELLHELNELMRKQSITHSALLTENVEMLADMATAINLLLAVEGPPFGGNHAANERWHASVHSLEKKYLGAHK